MSFWWKVEKLCEFYYCEFYIDRLVVFSSRVCFIWSQMLLKFLAMIKDLGVLFSTTGLFIPYISLDGVYYLSTL